MNNKPMDRDEEIRRDLARQRLAQASKELTEAWRRATASAVKFTQRFKTAFGIPKEEARRKPNITQTDQP